ncbi:hypothetical protein B0H19DRAFT_1256080 [Mycena capillaripes]|nr:hypothetical protein B0H19DRAFT_1256080 [Mycena capillaripes]
MNKTPPVHAHADWGLFDILSLLDCMCSTFANWALQWTQTTAPSKKYNRPESHLHCVLCSPSGTSKDYVKWAPSTYWLNGVCVSANFNGVGRVVIDHRQQGQESAVCSEFLPFEWEMVPAHRHIRVAGQFDLYSLRFFVHFHSRSPRASRGSLSTLLPGTIRAIWDIIPDIEPLPTTTLTLFDIACVLPAVRIGDLYHRQGAGGFTFNGELVLAIVQDLPPNTVPSAGRPVGGRAEDDPPAAHCRSPEHFAFQTDVDVDVRTRASIRQNGSRRSFRSLLAWMVRARRKEHNLHPPIRALDLASHSFVLDCNARQLLTS